MDYIIVKNKDKMVIAYGPNDGNFDHFLANGETSEIVSQEVADGYIAEIDARLKAEAAQAASHKAALLAKLGISADEAKLLLS